MAKLLVKNIILIISNFYNSVFHSKSIAIILSYFVVINFSNPVFDILAIKNHLEDSQDNIVVIDGYCQYDTSLIFADSDYSAAFQENFSLNYKNNNFQSSLNNYSQKIKLALANSYLVAIHLRRGDYLNSIHRTDWVKDVFYPMNIDPIIKDLNHYLRINQITNSVNYVATDDPQFCEEYFRKKGIIILTAHDIFKDLDQDDENEKLLFDIAVLASAQMLIASNSSLSLFASLLNETASIFWRQTYDGETVSFDPRATSILYGL